MKLKVTSAGNKEQALSKVGAALYVITREDIASSGANNIPDLLRLVPGVEVAQINGNQWVISIRGFNSFYSNKVLALIDGRALYQPSFLTVLWDMQDVPLEDVERIEVIRGPGGTIWGANAVNGVINIIARHARDTPGGRIAAGAGSWRKGDGWFQYGGDIGSEGTYRAFAKYFDVTGSVFPSRQGASDAWHSWAAGFRSDWDLSPRDTLSVQADLRNTIEGGTALGVFSQPAPSQAVINNPIRNFADDVMGTWRHTLADGSETTLRVYCDRIDRYGEAGTDIRNDTVDADFEQHRAVGARNDLVWGLERADLGTRLNVAVTPAGGIPYLVLPLSFANLARARDYGAASFFHWTATQRWTLSPGYSFLQMAAWNATLRYVSRLAAPNISSYAGADTALQWRPRDDLQVSTAGQNLLSPRHMEFGDVQKVLIPSEVQRSVFGKLTWRF